MRLQTRILAVNSLILLLLSSTRGFVSRTTRLGRPPLAIHQQKSSPLQASISLPLDLDDNSPSPQAQSSAPASPKVGVLLLNLGGPETGDDVEGFLYNLFADPDIIRLPGPLSPLQPLIAYFISKRRAPKSRAAYESIGGGSPILKYSNAQADLMCKSIKERYGLTVKAYIGMRYWYPFTEEALAQIRADKIQALVILPLYPQFSISTSGSSLRVLQEEFSKHAAQYTNLFHTVVPSWYERPGYVNAMVNLLQKELDGFTPAQIQEAKTATPDKKPLHVLFSAHGVPQSYIQAGDPYKQQIEACVAAISKQVLANNDNVEIHLSYQSRVGPIEWLRPYTDDVLPELGESGVKNLVVVPISFVSEHIETLEEIDIEYRELAQESGISNWKRCPALNTSPAFIQDMADMVVQALNEPAQTVTEACVANKVGDMDLQLVGAAGSSTGSLLSVDDYTAVAGVQGVGADSDLYDEAKRKRRQGDLQTGERWNARLAMLGVLVTILVELINGKSLVNMFGL